MCCGIILWDFKLVLQFPPGAAIIFPSTLIHHSNIWVQRGETHVLVTQYTARVIHCWLEFPSKKSYLKSRYGYKLARSFFCSILYSIYAIFTDCILFKHSQREHQSYTLCTDSIFVGAYGTSSGKAPHP